MQAMIRPRRSPLVMTVVLLAIAVGALMVTASVWTEFLWFRFGRTPTSR